MRLLGCTVLLVPFAAEMQRTAGGIFAPNHFKRSTLTFKVLAVGPGAYRWRKGKRKCFVQPECAVGDLVLCRASLDGSIVKEAFEDGTGRIVIHGEDANGNSNVLMKWEEP